MIEPRTLKGFRDYLPEAMIARERLIDTARRVYRSYGFSPIDTPALEYLENVLPPRVRQALWPFLMPPQTPAGAQQHEQTIASLLQSSASVTVRSIARDLEYRRIAGFGRA